MEDASVIPSGMGSYDDLLTGIRSMADKHGSAESLAKFLGVNPNLISRWINRERSPRFDALGPVLDKLGAKIVFPGDDSVSTVHELVFREPKIVGVEEFDGKDASVKPVEDNYLAVPMVNQDVAAGTGRIPFHKVTDWVVVFRHDPGIVNRSNLVAVRVGKDQRSMVPHIHPGDILLVDKNDNVPDPEGKIMLVIDPEEGEAIKRVSWRHRAGDDELTFYSDNAAENPPRTYRLREEYGANEWSRAIAGRVVWAWSDMTKK